MNKRLLIQLVVPAAIFASIVALFTGEREAISLQIWIAVFLAATAWSALVRLHGSAPSVPLNKLFITGSNQDSSAALAPASANRSRLVESWILRSRDNPRAFSQQLQPRLIELAGHFLAINHGVDTERNPQRVQLLLGDLYWLIDVPSGERMPTVTELDRFMAIVTAEKEVA